MKSGKLVLAKETVVRLKPSSADLKRTEAGRQPTGGTHPTTTVNTIKSGCC